MGQANNFLQTDIPLYLATNISPLRYWMKCYKISKTQRNNILETQCTVWLLTESIFVKVIDMTFIHMFALIEMKRKNYGIEQRISSSAIISIEHNSCVQQLYRYVQYDYFSKAYPH